MYTTHQSQIQDYAAASPEHTYNVLRFVVGTIQTRFRDVPRIIDDVEQRGTCPLLTARQHTALAFLWEGRHMVSRAIRERHGDSVDLMAYLTTLPMLGMVKAGFAAQLLTGSVGCIDTHNQRIYCPRCMGQTPSHDGTRCGLCSLDKARAWKAAVRLDGQPARIYARVLDYVRICTLIGTATLWNTWCALVALKYPAIFPSAEAVSALHVDLCCR